jgi:(E)-4-hydroxy-3-methyl-but-2-enyl pyrophosphate reductase
MKIIVAQNTGLCYGVKRALTLAKETRRKRTGRVATLGDLIHNPQVISDLRKRGLDSVEDIAGLGEGTVIIRSHGVSPDVTRLLKRRKIDVVDATCPIVTRIQELVARLARAKQEIIIVGDPGHPEIRGLIGYSRGRGRIVENETQAARLPMRKSRAVLAQSTQDMVLFEKVVGALLSRTEELCAFNTICRSTQTRQRATSELAEQVDVLFIVGGASSSNTRKLYEISKRLLRRTYFIENAGQIKPAMLRGASTIGISGGASTPPEAIEDAVRIIEQAFEHNSHREEIRVP